MTDKPTVACPVCDSLHPEYVETIGNWTWFQCTVADCGHLYHVPMTWNDIYERLQNDIDQLAPVVRIGQGDNRKDWP